jgi:hypothetical protein
LGGGVPFFSVGDLEGVSMEVKVKVIPNKKSFGRLELEDDALRNVEKEILDAGACRQLRSGEKRVHNI